MPMSSWTSYDKPRQRQSRILTSCLHIANGTSGMMRINVEPLNTAFGAAQLIMKYFKDRFDI
jgi:hypothetical protein